MTLLFIPSPALVLLIVGVLANDLGVPCCPDFWVCGLASAMEDSGYDDKNDQRREASFIVF